MKPNPYEIDLAAVANEVEGNLVINYYTAEIKFTNEQLQNLKSQGVPCDVWSLIMAGLVSGGMSVDEVKAYLNEAQENDGHLSVSFEAPDEGGLKVYSKEKNPMMDQLVQCVENQNEED